MLELWVYIESLKKHVGEEVEIKGWLRRFRSSGKIQFLYLRDGTGFVQGIVEKSSVSTDIFEQTKDIKMEASVIVRGIVKEESRAPGGVEIHVNDVEIVQNPDEDFPINKPDHGIDFLMENRHLWLRTKRQFHLSHIRNEIIKATREFYNSRNFVLVDTPIFTGSIGESAGNCFELDYFDYGKAYLAQTGQLYLEAACMGLGKVYNLGPTFRAEKSKTRRHLIEFWMNEAEVAYYKHEDNIRLQEDLVEFVVKKTLERAEDDLNEIKRDTSLLEKVEKPFPRITYTDAVKLLQKKGFNIEWGGDFGSDEETAIAKEFDKPVVIEKYPRMAKAFYMPPDPHNPDVVLCNDLIAPEGYGEIIGASERIWQEDVLIERINEFGLDHASYDWYIDLRKFGSVPHSGFGMGIERVVAWICGLEHVREAIPFARTLYRIHP